MSVSFKKRLKWYGGIFLIASIVFGVNMLRYDKIKSSYEKSKIWKCNKKYFFAMQRDIKPTMADQIEHGLSPFRKKNKYDDIKPRKKRMLDGLEPRKKGMLDGLEPRKLQPNDPRNGLSKAQIAEAEALYETCLSNRLTKVQEAKNKKDQTEFMLGAGVILMIFSVLVAFIDFIIQLYKKGKITKIGMSRFMIVVSIIWVLVAFSKNYHSSGLRIDDFVLFGIVPMVVLLGLMWAFGLFKLKD